MNRIERLIWEETQLKEIARLQRESHGSRGAKFISIMVLVGVIALLASRVSIPPLGEAVTQALAPASIVYSPVAKPSKARDAGTSAATMSRGAADGAADATPRDDPPMAPF